MDDVVPWWADRDRAVSGVSKDTPPRDAETFVRVDDRLKKLARYLQPFFMEPPPEMDTASMHGWSDLFRVGKRFRGISSSEISQLISFLTGSLGEFLDHNYESEKIKTMFLANNVYGKHGGPYQPGTAIGLLFHLLSGGEHELQGFYGHVMGGMGAITQALASAGKKLGVEIRTSAPVVADHDARRAGDAEWSWKMARKFAPAWCSRTPTPSEHFCGCCLPASCLRTSWIPFAASRWMAPARRSIWCFRKSRRFTGHALAGNPSGTHLLHACAFSGVRRALL